jgi:hypothetical protein
LYNAIGALRGPSESLKKVELRDVYKIDWEFYKKHYPNPAFISEYQAAYNKIDLDKLVNKPDHSQALEKFFTQFEANVSFSSV